MNKAIPIEDVLIALKASCLDMAAVIKFDALVFSLKHYCFLERRENVKILQKINEESVKGAIND